MPKITYTEKRFNAEAEATIEQANKIIEDYKAQGYDLTLRQIYYQFVGHDLFPDDRRWTQNPSTGKWLRDPNGTKNAEPNYKWLGEIINDGRLAGLIDWEAIVDRTRNLRSSSHWDSPKDIVEACAKQFRIDKWARQPTRVEVWIEKDALIGVIEGVCQRNDLGHFSCRGYTSQSEMWVAAQRFNGYFEQEGKEGVVIIHLGDHDPSGIDMTRDIEDRLKLFCTEPDRLEIRRIALMTPQVKQFKLPPNPAKVTDSRAKDYIAYFGESSWELDALDPRTINKLVQQHIDQIRDADLWDEAIKEELKHRDAIAAVAKKLK
jgi:hypothetical protein